MPKNLDCKTAVSFIYSFQSSKIYLMRYCLQGNWECSIRGFLILDHVDNNVLFCNILYDVRISFFSQPKSESLRDAILHCRKNFENLTFFLSCIYTGKLKHSHRRLL